MSYMATQADNREDFYRRPEKPTESICMFWFLTVRASKADFLRNAEDGHRKECPGRPIALPDESH